MLWRRRFRLVVERGAVAIRSTVSEFMPRTTSRDALNKHGEGLSDGCWGSFVEIL